MRAQDPRDRDDDIAQVIALWHAAGVARPWNDPARDIAFARRDEHSTVLVGMEGARIVASAMVGEDGHRGWVYYVAIDRSSNAAVSDASMMQAAEEWLIRRGVWKVQLLVRADNAQAIALLRPARLSRYRRGVPAENSGSVRLSHGRSEVRGPR